MSKESGYPEIVIFGYDPETGFQGVATWGESVEQSEDAARAGNYLKSSLGWPDDLCNEKPKPKAEAVDLAVPICDDGGIDGKHAGEIKGL